MQRLAVSTRSPAHPGVCWWGTVWSTPQSPVSSCALQPGLSEGARMEHLSHRKTVCPEATEHGGPRRAPSSL